MSQLAELLQQCTVKLSLPDHRGWGTGFFVAPGWILTCAHVVQMQGHSVQARWQSTELAAVVKEFLPDYDLALLNYETSSLSKPPCTYLSEEFSPGHALYAYGYSDEFPEGASLLGECEGSATENHSPLILFKATRVRSGVSGSPLLNRQTGKVCGMVKFTRDRSFDLGGGAIPARVILEQFPELRDLQREFHEGDRRWVSLMGSIFVDKSTAKQIDTDALVRQMRLLSYQKIKELGFIRMLWGSKRLVSVNDIYVELKVLQQPTATLYTLTANKQKPQSVLKALQEHRKLLLLGKPGSGKTTLQDLESYDGRIRRTGNLRQA